MTNTITPKSTSCVEPVPIPIEPPPGYWVRESGHSPIPVTPLSRQLWRHTEWVRATFAEQGVLLDTIAFEEIGGWLYLRPVPLVDRPGSPPPPEWLTPLLFRLVPTLRRRTRQAALSYRTDVPGQILNRWQGEWRSSLADRAARLRDTDLAGASDAVVMAQFEAACSLAADAYAIHFRVLGGIIVSLGALEFFCRDQLGWVPQRSLELLVGMSPTSTAPVAALGKVIEAASRSSIVSALLCSGAPPQEVLNADPAFTAAFEDYQRSYGHRALGTDLVEPTLVERPDIALDLVRHQLDGAQRAMEHAAAELAEEILAEAYSALGPNESRQRFGHLLARAQRGYGAREDSEFYTISFPLAVLRRAALEVGSRMAARGQLDGPGDVFFLESAELPAAFASGQPQHPIVRRRRGEHAWALAHPGPASYGEDPGPPPSLHRLPAEVRLATEAAMWMLEQIEGVTPAGNEAAAEPDVIRGLAAAPGRYRGTARILRDESDFHRLKPGDVLVCSTTSPVWSMLFSNAAALVSDSGGMLSHPAIIAREFGIPAVTASGTATARIRDGEIVTVDGSAGTITVES